MADISAKQATLDDLKKAIQGLEEKVSASRNDLKSIEDARKKAEDIAAKLATHKEEVKKKQKQAEDLKKEIEQYNGKNPDIELTKAKEEFDQLQADLEKATAEHKIKVKQYDEWLEKEGKKKDSSSDARGDVKISLVELSSSHVFAGRLKVESVSRGYGLDSIQADDILMKLDGSDILGLRKGEVLNLFKGKPGSKINLLFYREHLSGYLKLDATAVRKAV